MIAHTCSGFQDDSTHAFAHALEHSLGAFLFISSARLRDQTRHAVVEAIAEFLLGLASEITCG